MNKKLFGTALLGLLLSAATGTFVSCKDYDDDIENLQNQINGLKSLQTSVDGLKSDLAGVQSTCQANIASAIADLKNGDVKKALADAADAAAKASAASAEAANATTAATGAQAAADAAAEAAAKAQAAADAANTLAEAAKAAAEGISLEEKDAAALAEIAKLAEKVAGVEGAMLKAADVEKMIADAQLSGAATDAATLEKINEALAKLQEATASIIGKRLTSLVYAPTEYINGIEAINFVNLSYTNWGDKKYWTADAPTAWAVWNNIYVYSKVTVENYGTKATYLVSPKGVTMDGIESLSFHYNNATNTRTSAEDVTIAIVDSSLVDGKLVLDLKKNVKWGQKLPEPNLLKDLLKDLKVIARNGSKVTLKVSNSKDKAITAYVDGAIYGNYHLADDVNNISGETGVVEGADKSFKGIITALFDGNFTANASVELKEGQIEAALKNFDLELDGSEKLVIAALEAKLAESVKDENEKGKEVSVFSDWARVNEADETPRIHYTGIKDHTTYSDKKSSHFWPFHAIYADGTWEALDGTPIDRRNAETGKDGKKLKGEKAVYVETKASVDYYAITAIYNDTLNLNNLVTICTVDDNGNYKHEIKKDEMDKYGFKFEFNKMHYIVENNTTSTAGNLSQDETDQYDFAKLSDDGILTPCSQTQKDFNANAIGRTPVIQVVLRDTKNNGVVDVRYFKVKWVAELPSTEISEVGFTKVFGYSCDEYSDAWIYEAEMNEFYAELNNGNGIGKNQFRSAYPNLSESKDLGHIYLLPEGQKLDSAFVEKFMASYDADDYVADANGNVVKNLDCNWIGNISWEDDETVDNQTQNLSLKFFPTYTNPHSHNWDGSLNPGDETSYTVNGFFWFESADASQRVYVPVTLNVKKNSFHSNYNYPLWNTAAEKPYTAQPKQSEIDKYRNINPQVMSDDTYGKKAGFETTQIIGSVTAGYMYNGKTPASANNLVVYQWADSTIQLAKQKADKSADPFAYTMIKFDVTRLDSLRAITPTTKEWKDAHKGYDWFVWSEYDGAGSYIEHLYYGTPKTSPNGSIIGKDKGDEAARIEGNSVFLVESKPGMADSKPSEAALLLVGKKAPVVVYAQQCKAWEQHDQYLFKFIDPLYFEQKKNSATLYDIKNNGDEVEISAANSVFLKENYGLQNNEIKLWFKKGEKESDDNIARKVWYGVGTPVVDVKHIKTNLNKNGGKDASCNTLLSEIIKGYDEDGNGIPLYDVKVGIKVKGETTKEWTPVLDVQPDAAIYTPVYEDAANKVGLKEPTAAEIEAAEAAGFKLHKVNGKMQTQTAKDVESSDTNIPVVLNKKNTKTYGTGATAVKNKYNIYSWTKDGEGLMFFYDADPRENFVDKQPAFKVGDTYYTLPNSYTQKEEIALADLIMDKIKYPIYTDDTENYMNVTTPDKTKRAYEYNGKWYTEQNGKGLEVVDAKDAHIESSKWMSGKQHSDKEVEVAVFVTNDDPNGTLDEYNQPAQVRTMIDGEDVHTEKAWKLVYELSNQVPVWEQFISVEGEIFKEDTLNDDGSAWVRFENMSGNAIAEGESFDVQIPVYVTTKWNDKLTGYINVTIKSGINAKK